MSPVEGCPTVFQIIWSIPPGYHQVSLETSLLDKNLVALNFLISVTKNLVALNFVISVRILGI